MNTPKGSSHIFISYRRDDSAGYTRVIYDHLIKRFSKDRIFMDVDAIEPGLPFDEVINQAVGRCEILLAMIGKRWMEQQTGVGPRINDPKDFVRIEIAAALSRNIRVIPVLLDGAIMPSEEALPEPLRALARRNAIEVSNSRFNSDVSRLVEAVSKVLGEADAPSSPQVPRSRRSILYWLLGGFAAIAIFPLVRLVVLWMSSDGSVLFYNAGSGVGATARLDGAGNYTFVRSIYGFATEWTQVVGASNGSVLFYNASTGDGATARIDGAGTYQFVGSISDFARGWTHIVSANAGSLLFYNAASGEGATARLDSAGNYQFVRSISRFATEWTHITGTASGGVFFYNASTGDGATARIDGAGTYQFVGSISGFARGWTHIAGL